MAKVNFKGEALYEKKFSLEVSTKLETDPILEVAEQNGVKLSFGCRAGSCGVCRVKVKQGLDLLLPRGIVEEDTWSRCQDGENIRLACQSRIKENAAGTLEICPAPEVVLKDD